MTDFGINEVEGTPDGPWNMLWNWKVPDYGNGDHIAGCRQQVQTGDDVIWAWVDGEQNSYVFLKVVPSDVTVKKGGSVTFTITDGLTGLVQPNATIHGAQANSKGQVVVPFPSSGYYPFKAKQTGAIRSELVKVTVTS